MALQKKAEPPEREVSSLLIQDANIWTDKGIRRGSILIEQGKIRRIARKITNHASQTIKASRLLALPGLVDAHVHLRDLDLAYKEDFATGTRAAAAGGFTTLLDMPNTQPPTDSGVRLMEKQEIAAKKIRVNVGFHVAAVPDPGDIRTMASTGAFSLKLYMPRPIAQLDVKDDNQLLGLMNASKETQLPITVHAEEPGLTENLGGASGFLEIAKARSPESEVRAVSRILGLQKKSGCPVHFCHLTLSLSLARIRSSSRKLTSEVTPHHLLLSQKALSRLGWRAWMVPPLRPEKMRKELLQATAQGLATIIASDHAPHTIEEKDQPPEKSFPGVPGLETTLPLILTLVNKRLLTLTRLVKLLSGNPAQVFGLESKGKLQAGADGDLILVDLKKKSRIDSSRFFSKAKFSPFDGFHTQGAVHCTIVGGTPVYDDGEIVAREGTGSVLRRNLPG